MTHPYTRLLVLPAPPDADNDVTEGYELGDVVHVAGGAVYDCRDATEGVAVWEERGSGGVPVLMLDDLLDVDADPVNDLDMLIFSEDNGGWVLTNRSTLALSGHTHSAISNDGWIAGTGTWSYTSADSPSFVASVPDADAALMSVGWRWKLTQTSAKYFIVTAKGSPSGGFTPVTIYGGTDYTLANAAITSPYFSPVKAPFGFPMDPSKWTVQVTDTSDRTQATPTANTWYNLGSITISIPIGCWNVNYKVLARPADNPNTLINQYSTLSTANNSESDADFTTLVTLGGASGSLAIVATQHCFPKPISLTVKTSYFLNAKTSLANLDSIAHRGDAGTTVIRAVCAYL